MVEDTTKAYDLSVNVLHADSFAYENVYVMVTTIFPGGDSTRNQLSLQLARPDGQWQGNCSGNTCELSIPMSTAAYFKHEGRYSLIFEQHSRESDLYGIESLGLTIKETPK
jgi:gliding motility-associated lipoprotein GldH